MEIVMGDKNNEVVNLNNIKAMRNRAKITQAALAAQLGISQSTIAMWESRSNLPRAGMLPELAKILNCTIDDLLKYDRS